MNEQQRQAYLDQIDYGRIERVIAYKNVQFIIDHQHDTLEQVVPSRVAWIEIGTGAGSLPGLRAHFFCSVRQPSDG